MDRFLCIKNSNDKKDKNTSKCPFADTNFKPDLDTKICPFHTHYIPDTYI